jgi:protein-L-isoaspartate(D-aspartate) O-methyltransferase
MIDVHARRRAAMVAEQIADRDVRDPAVLAAMLAVPRHRMVPADLEDRAYDDCPLPLAHGMTISQPYIVALMTERAAVRPGARVLEVGTGSGYQCAVLSTLGARVWSIEIIEPLARSAAASLLALGHRPELAIGDGHAGWPEAAPFDAIVVTAAPALIPQPLIDQLAPGGRLVIPVGTDQQELRVLTRVGTGDGVSVERVLAVRFVPMTTAS